MDLAYRSCVIYVQDIAASRCFYEELLGQKVEMDFGPSVEFRNGFALWQIDHAFQTVYERTPGTERQPGSRNVELHFETTNVAAASDRLSEAGVEFVHPVREMPWGTRIFRVRDPDGHVVAVAERTAMPLEIVEQIAGA